MDKLEEQARAELCSEREPLFHAKDSVTCPAGSNLVFGTGPSDARIVFVGSHPGRSENESGEPFTGKAGRLLRRLCTMYDIDLDSIYVTNVLKLALFGHQQQPPNDAIIRHSRWLERQIQFIQPRLVVALGNIAAKTLLHLFPNGNLEMTSTQEQDLQIKRINGHVHDLGGSYTIVTTFNPIMYADEAYQKPLEHGFRAINLEIREARTSLTSIFDIKPVVKTIVATSSTTTASKTRTEIEEAIQTDEDAAEIFDQILDFFECVTEDTDVITFDTIQEVATSFDQPTSIVQDIAVFAAHAKSPHKRSRTSSPTPPSPKRHKSLAPSSDE